MDDLGSATENQVILAWLQAEIESVSFQQYLAGEPPNAVYLAQALRAARSPNLRDADQNELRRKIIVKTHGFGLGIKSFEGLANDIQWRRARVTSHEVGEMLYASGHTAWTALAPVTRKVAEGASNVGHIFSGARPTCWSWRSRCGSPIRTRRRRCRRSSASGDRTAIW